MASRSYGQYCGLAHALDMLGERWTLLVLRELLPGPRRFSDVLDALPGLGTGLLTTRLRTLEADGLVHRRRLPPPAGSTVYELTGAGRELEPVLLGLARFGADRLGPRREGEAFRPQWAMIAMGARHDTEAARGIEATYEFEIGDAIFHASVDDGHVEMRDGPAHHPSVRVRCDAATFAQIAHDPTAAPAALTAGSLLIEGSPDAIETCLAIFAPARPGARRVRAEGVPG